jgi:hypothetical protein
MSRQQYVTVRTRRRRLGQGTGESPLKSRLVVREDVKKGGLGRTARASLSTPLALRQYKRGCAHRDGMEITGTLIGNESWARPDPQWLERMTGQSELIGRSK